MKTVPIKIGRDTFRGFWDYDGGQLLHADFPTRLRWLEYRFKLVLLGPLDALVRIERRQYVWFAAVQLICSGVEALARFEFDGNETDRFCKFVEKYFAHDVWATGRFALPRPAGEGNKTPAWHLYSYFRSGLSHGMRITYGALEHPEDGGPGYLEVREVRPFRREVLCIAPRALYSDFCEAQCRYFREMERSVPDLQRRFMETFNDLLTEPWKH